MEICGTHVDDALNVGNLGFEVSTEAALKKPELKPRVYDSFDFFGTEVSTNSSHISAFDQRH